MSAALLGIDAFSAGLLHACEQVCAAREELCALDAAAGDGDLGATLAAGFYHVHQTLRASDDRDAGVLLREVGGQLASKAPSTIGALLATAFMRGGNVLDGVTELDAAHVAAMLEAAATGVSERGGAVPGQRTVVDAMAPAAAAAAEAAACGAGPLGALDAAAAAAQAGAEETAAMEPQFGRAGWIADRARGHRDAGARAWAIYLAALAKGCRAGVAA